MDVFKEVHNISDYVEVDLEKVTSTFEAAFLQMMKEEGLGSSRCSVQYSVGSNSTPGSSVGGPTPVKMETPDPDFGIEASEAADFASVMEASDFASASNIVASLSL